MGALTGLRVIDASRILAGPFCGQLFAEQGAEVIKIEPPEGDPNRGWPLMVDGWSTNFLSVNRGKKSVTLNLRTDRGRELFYELAATADVIIHNYLPGTAAKLGIDDDKLAACNPALVRVVLTGYGAKGAMANKPGYDTMITAYSGIMSLTGEPDRPPVKPGVSAVDIAAGSLAFGGALAAIHGRAANGGRGQRVDISLLETAVTFLGFHGLNWLQQGQVDAREGANYGPLVPFGRYRCRDGDLMIGASGQANWDGVCRAIGGSLGANPDYKTNDLRFANRERLRIDMEALLGEQDCAHWVVALDAAGVPNAPVQTVDQVLSDPQVIANDMVVSAKRRDGSEVTLLGMPFKLSDTPGDATVAPPALGEDTAEVLETLLNIPREAIDALREQNIV
jgi:crotonobetainyl-CoA:carnitine CoA-transferase CaiB-like acyl-CoA transferase